MCKTKQTNDEKMISPDWRHFAENALPREGIASNVNVGKE